MCKVEDVNIGPRKETSTETEFLVGKMFFFYGMTCSSISRKYIIRIFFVSFILSRYLYYHLLLLSPPFSLSLLSSSSSFFSLVITLIFFAFFLLLSRYHSNLLSPLSLLSFLFLLRLSSYFSVYLPSPIVHFCFPVFTKSEAFTNSLST